MKFDIVVGNPPYGIRTVKGGSSDLHLKIMKTVLDFCTDRLCFIMPSKPIIQQLNDKWYNMFKNVNTEETKVLMPLEWEEKKDIIKYLRKNNLDTLCNYCEGNQNDELGEEEPCHKCHSCKVHDEAVRELEEAEKVLDKKE